jgi:hypothetical protein
MLKRGHTEVEILRALREVEAGAAGAAVCWKLGISSSTFGTRLELKASRLVCPTGDHAANGFGGKLFDGTYNLVCNSVGKPRRAPTSERRLCSNAPGRSPSPSRPSPHPPRPAGCSLPPVGPDSTQQPLQHGSVR